jgi:hypothetical protein
MSELDFIFEYDEEAAIAFIQNYLPQELKDRFPDDIIYYFLDVICDFYEKNDYLSEDNEEKEERELIRFIIDEAKREGIGTYSEEEIRLLLKAEEAYSDTLDILE